MSFDEWVGRQAKGAVTVLEAVRAVVIALRRLVLASAALLGAVGALITAWVMCR